MYTNENFTRGKYMKRAILIIVGLFIIAQLLQTNKSNPTTNHKLEIKTPERMKQIFKNACYDCHSYETKWPFYSYIAPMSWSIKSHVEDGRASLNFSIWENYNEVAKQKLQKEIFRTMYASMPPSSYIVFHKEAELSNEQRKEVRDWLISLGVKP